MAMFQGIIFIEGQTESTQTFRSASLFFVGATPAPVKLVLSSEVVPPTEVGPRTRPPGTILAVHMTQEAALMAYQRIGELAKTMGWPLPPEA
jgi:hypothetical protein